MSKKLNGGHYFELMDRCHILLMNIDTALIEHPAINKRMKKRIEFAQAAIMDVYQWAGAKHHGNTCEVKT